MSEMDQKPKKTVVVPRQQAVFRLDRFGRWHNRHGAFQHKKIIDYFHSCMARDEDGYYLRQDCGDWEEKVYFPYEDTALFVFDVIEDRGITLVLNTGMRIALDPGSLLLMGDILYVRLEDERARFTDRSMMKISPWLEEESGRYFFCFSGKRTPLETKAPENPAPNQRSA